jgi:hypothetical protein
LKASKIRPATEVATIAKPVNEKEALAPSIEEIKRWE